MNFTTGVDGLALEFLTKNEIGGFGEILITCKVLDARRRGATTEAYETIRRKPAPAKAGGGAIEGNAADDALQVIRGDFLL